MDKEFKTVGEMIDHYLTLYPQFTRDDLWKMLVPSIICYDEQSKSWGFTEDFLNSAPRTELNTQEVRVINGNTTD